MQDSIFTKIAKGDIPAHKIYEDEKTLAFLDIHPVTRGHALVIPKTQVEFIWDLSDEDYRAVMATARKVARRLREATGKQFVSLKVVGTDVPHAHVHLIPFQQTNELQNEPDMDEEVDHEALAAVADGLRSQ